MSNSDDYAYRRASTKQNEPFIDVKPTLWLITWFQNRQFYTSAHNEIEAKKKAKSFIASTFKLEGDLLDLACSDMKVEDSEIKWPM